MKVPFLDLKGQYREVKESVDRAVAEVMESQQFILGAKVEECERAVADYCKCGFGIGVSSGTDAILVSLMAEGIGPGDEVITTPYTFFATAGAIARVGATPVFVDIDPSTYNLNAALIECKVTRKTRAIIPVHLYGQMADMEAIMNIAEKHGLVVIEDAAQAIGAEYKGRRAGSFGQYGCFSFFPSKNLGAAGDGGMVVTQDAARAEKVTRLRAHGSAPKYYHSIIGGNFRLDALQSAVVLAKLPHLDVWTGRRIRNAERYDECLSEVAHELTTPARLTNRHVFNQYVVRCRRRDDLRRHLQKCDISSEVYYPIPLHLQECFQYLGLGAGEFPKSESAARETLALPIHAELTVEQAMHVISSIQEFCRAEGEVFTWA